MGLAVGIGGQGDGPSLLLKELKTLQLQAARSFDFCFQAPALREAAQRRGHRGCPRKVTGPQASSDNHNVPHQFTSMLKDQH